MNPTTAAHPVMMYPLLRERIAVLVLLCVCLLLPTASIQAGAVRPGFNAVAHSATDDLSVGLVPIGFPVNFNGTSYTQVYVSNNGNITFDAAQSTYTPFSLTTTNRIIIAPFFADVDTRGVGSGVLRYSSGGDTVGGRPAFGVTWVGVGYFNSGTDKLNSFQLVLIDRSDVEPGAFDIEFNYDQIQWETGDASGGTNGLGGNSARAGYANGVGATLELPGSAVPGGLLDSNLTTGLVNRSRNSGQLGRYVFPVRGGFVLNTVTLPATGVTENTAQLHASVEPSGQPTLGHFEYGTHPALVGAAVTPNVDLGSGIDAVPLDETVTGLQPNTTYYYRAVSARTGATIVGGILSFTTRGTGSVDPDFDPNVDGTVFTTVVQPDGRIVLGGLFTQVGGAPHDRVARVGADGVVDGTFNAGADGAVQSAAVQGDGGVVIGGSFANVNGTGRDHVARLKDDGTLDVGFNPGADGMVRGLAVQADGSIVMVGGFSTVAGMGRNRIARVDESGALDMAFDPDADGEIHAIALQADGKLVIGGDFTHIGGTPRSRVARLNANGTLDGAFAADADGIVRTLAVQADGAIVLGGDFTSIAGTPRSYLARLDGAGNVEAGFNPAPNGPVFSCVVQADGKLVIGGSFTNVGGASRNRVARLSAAGVVEAAFNANAGPTFVYSLAIEESGGILVGGDFTSVGSSARNRIARLENDSVTHDLRVLGPAKVRWLRGGAVPEVQGVSFESSVDGGVSWGPLGVGSRVTGGWELTGLTLPVTAQIRARGRVTAGLGGASAGLVETTAAFRIPTTLAATGITTTSALLHGSADPDGAPMSGHFEYGMDPALAGAQTTAEVDLGSGTGATPLDQAVAGLRPNTTYYFRVVTTGALGTTAGATLSFTTAVAPPGVATLPATGLTTAAAMLHASVDAYGDATTGHFEYGTDPTLTGASVTADVNLGSAQGAVALDEAVSGLADATVYYYRAVATNGAGPTYGAILSFTTAGFPPTVTLLPADNLTVNAATLHATVNAAGQATVGHFEYGTDPGLVGATVFTNVALGSGRGSVALDRRALSLDPATTYYYRATATNLAGTTQSTIGSFTTTEVIPEVVRNKGGGVPGELPGTVFVDFGYPAVDGGYVGGAATIRPRGGRGTQNVIYGGANGTVLVRAGGDAPNNSTWISLGDPVFGGEGFAFRAVTKPKPAAGAVFLLDERLGVADVARGISPRAGARETGLFSQLSIMGGIKRVAKLGGPAPGVGTGIFAKLPSFGFPRSRSGMVYTGFMKRDGSVTAANDFGVWRERPAGGDSDLVLRKGVPVRLANGSSRPVASLSVMIPVENASDQRRSFAPDGGLAAAATFGDGSSGVVRVAPDGSKDIPLDTNSAVTDEMGAPLTNVQFTAFKAPAIANGGVMALLAAFQSMGTGAPPGEAVYRSENGSLRRIANRYDPVPGHPETRFATLGHPSMGQSGMIGFIAALTGQRVTPASNRAFVVHFDGASTTVARLGEPAPGAGAGVVFRRLLSKVVTDTEEPRAVFTATVSGPKVSAGNNQGLWSVSPTRKVRLLLRTGGTIDVGTGAVQVRTFQALQAPSKNEGQGRSTDEVGFVTAKVKLSDGRSGVLRIPLP